MAESLGFHTLQSDDTLLDRLMLESGKHPAVLKDEACSPAGATIEGVRVLEKAGLRAAVIEAVVASCRKNAILGHET